VRHQQQQQQAAPHHSKKPIATIPTASLNRLCLCLSWPEHVFRVSIRSHSAERKWIPTTLFATLFFLMFGCPSLSPSHEFVARRRKKKPGFLYNFFVLCFSLFPLTISFFAFRAQAMKKMLTPCVCSSPAHSFFPEKEEIGVSSAKELASRPMLLLTFPIILFSPLILYPFSF